MDEILELAKAHWPFVAWAVVAMMIGQVVKSSVFTKAHAKKYAIPTTLFQRIHHWFFWWSYKTLAGHPVAAGMLVGTQWQDPEGAGWPLIGSMLYFAVAGVVSVFLFEFLKGLAKKKGVTLGPLPGQSEPPPEPEDDQDDTPVSGR